eukprot:4924891-Ditylum_brightwellii.AAC.1
MYRKYKATLEALTTFMETDTLLRDLPDSASVTSSPIIGNNLFFYAGLIREQQNTSPRPQSFDQLVHNLLKYMKRGPRKGEQHGCSVQREFASS